MVINSFTQVHTRAVSQALIKLSNPVFKFIIANIQTYMLTAAKWNHIIWWNDLVQISCLFIQLQHHIILSLVLWWWFKCLWRLEKIYDCLWMFFGLLTCLMCYDISMAVKESTTFMSAFARVKSGYKNKKKTCSETSRGFKETW